jgi:raffinose/stachyose/melibiose transport system permease protein
MKRLLTFAKYAVVALISLTSAYPFYALLYLALSSPARAISDQFVLLPDYHWQNFADAWKVSNLDRAMMNSFIITACALLLVVAVASSAGYSIARFANKFNSAVFNVLLISMMIPAIIITVPLYSLMRGIHGVNTHWAMILLMATNALPLAVFLYTSFIKMLPREVEESAIIDGCTFFSAFWRVTFHFLRPVTAAVVILSGLAIWNNYAQAVFFLQKSSIHTIPLAVSMFFQKYGAQWNIMAAAALIGLLPAVLAFLVFQKYFIKGITAGAVKG